MRKNFKVAFMTVFFTMLLFCSFIGVSAKSDFRIYNFEFKYPLISSNGVQEVIFDFYSTDSFRPKVVKLMLRGENVSDVSDTYDSIFQIPCYYNETNKTYHGVYDGAKTPSLHKNMYQYKPFYYGYTDEYGRIETGVIAMQAPPSFVICNDCYYGRHRGGAATPSKQAVCSICGTPYGDYAKGVTLNATKTTLQAGKTSTALKIEEKNPSDKVKKWTSSNPKVVSVHKKTGKLTAKKTGKATITVTMKSGATAKCKVTVKKSVDKTKKLTIVNVPKLKVGQKYQLIVRRNPVTATEKLTYEVSKNSGVSVNKKGWVMAKRSGSYIVTVKSSNGKRAKVRVNVG